MAKHIRDSKSCKMIILQTNINMSELPYCPHNNLLQQATFEKSLEIFMHCVFNKQTAGTAQNNITSNRTVNDNHYIFQCSYAAICQCYQFAILTRFI